MDEKVVFSLVSIFFISCSQEADNQHKTWWEYGGGPDQSKYVELEELNKSNVSQLVKKWEYPTGDSQPYQFNPVIVDTVMYVLAKNKSLVALNAVTGEEIWIHANLDGISRRGINYWESKDRGDRRILITMNNTLQAIDASTGLSILDFGDGGAVDLRVGLDRDPETVSRVQSHTPGRIYQDLILLGSSPGEGYLSAPGHLRAYNVVTGDHVWTFRTIPHPGEYGYDTWPKDAYQYAGGANTWGEISLDKDRGIAYFPTGSATYDYYGADRIGSNLFANCILALNALTGERIWHFQAVHHDLWDYDLTAAPQLIAVQHQGKEVAAVAVATKQGFLFVFDRVTGEPLWPVEERPVPTSDMPGEQAWSTQPFPTVIPPFTPQTVTPDDITTLFLTEEERAEWQQRVSSARTGLYTPLSTVETIARPGAVGGANWGNTASIPYKGIVFVQSQDYPSFYKLEERPGIPRFFRSEKADPVASARGKESYRQFCQLCHGENRNGSALGPSLVNLSGLSLEYLTHVITMGMGRMAPVPHIEEEAIPDILAFLGGSVSVPGDEAETVELPQGNVVASGGAKHGQTPPRQPYNWAGRDYPPGVDAPPSRYYTGYGLGYPYILNPPWSSITAYDLNRGTIKWSKPLGVDDRALEEGAEDTGVMSGSQRSSMIVTSTGIVFSTVTNGEIYAFDAEDGTVLWQTRVPVGLSGLPSMYEINGKHYLVVNATTPTPKYLRKKGEEEQPTYNDGRGSYIVFGLPD